jgi:DNA-binding GntR family transcriptional regulator
MIAPFIVQGAMRRNVAELREMAETMLLAESVESWMRLNFAFHAYLYSLADRPHTESILRGLLSSVQPYSLENIQRLGGREQASREHVEMVDAIQDGDAETLASLFVVHLQSAKERLVSTMSAEPDPLSDLRL